MKTIRDTYVDLIQDMLEDGFITTGTPLPDPKFWEALIKNYNVTRKPQPFESREPSFILEIQEYKGYRIAVFNTHINVERPGGPGSFEVIAHGEMSFDAAKQIVDSEVA